MPVESNGLATVTAPLETGVTSRVAPGARVMVPRLSVTVLAVPPEVRNEMLVWWPALRLVVPFPASVKLLLALVLRVQSPPFRLMAPFGSLRFVLVA